MKLQNAKDGYSPAPKAKYKVRLTAVEATSAKSSGAPMITWTGEITAPEEHAGKQFFDNAITDENFKGAGFGKKKLQGLGVNVNVEADDAAIAQQLLGLEVYADLEVVPQQEADATGKWVDKYVNGQKALKNVASAYSTLNVGGNVGQAAQVQTAPVQAPTFTPPIQHQQMPVQPQGQWAPPQGWTPPQGFAPTQQMPQMPIQNGGAQSAVPPWIQQQPTQGPTVDAPATRGPGRPKKS